MTHYVPLGDYVASSSVFVVNERRRVYGRSMTHHVALGDYATLQAYSSSLSDAGSMRGL